MGQGTRRIHEQRRSGKSRLLMKAIIHVHQQKIRKGEPAIIVRTYRGSTHHRAISVDGPVTIVQSDKPDSCGARVWIEAKYEDIQFNDERKGKAHAKHNA